MEARLRLVAELSRSAMRELRRPIDRGRIFRGEEMGEVLEARAGTGWRWWSGRSGPALCMTTRCSVRCAVEARL